MIAILLAGVLCPADAVSAGAGVFVHTVPANPVVGYPAEIHCYLYWMPWSFWGPTAAVGGGTVTITMGGQVFDATPTNGVPLMGGEGCADKWYCQLPIISCVFSNAGAFLLTGTYRGFADVYPLTASQVRGVRVWDNLLHYDKGRVYWFGQGTYTLEASEDLRDWSTVATLTGRNGYYEYNGQTNQPQRFYRYRRL